MRGFANCAGRAGDGMGSVMLLDTSGMIWRASNALPQPIEDAAGNPANAVLGYLDRTSKLIRKYGPDRATHVLDDVGRPAARVDAFPATRPPARVGCASAAV